MKLLWDNGYSNVALPVVNLLIMIYGTKSKVAVNAYSKIISTYPKVLHALLND